jgi:hypothetical protein
MIPAIVTHRYIICPYCGEDEKRIDHLEPARINESTFGPWSCDECGKSYRGKFTESGWEIELLPEECKRVLVELQHHLHHDLKLIVWGLHFTGAVWNKDDSEETYDDHHKFYYNEHTCPTNYLSGVVEIIEGDSNDPHGVFEFVRELSAEEQTKMEEEHGL